MWEALQFEFMRNALAAGLLASVLCGVIGTLVVVNRIVFLAGGIAHSAYGGIGIAFFFGLPYLAGTIGFSLVMALVMAGLTLGKPHRADTVIGVLWAVGMAVGIILLDLTPGYNVDLMSYLFGSILTVPTRDLVIMGGLTAVVVAVVGCFYREFLLIAYDAEFARLRGVRVTLLYMLLMAMLAVSIVMIIRLVGLILVIAMLTIPPYIAESRLNALWKVMIGASLLGIFFTVAGLGFSYAYNLTSGATIILVAGTVFFLANADQWLGLSRRFHKQMRAMSTASADGKHRGTAPERSKCQPVDRQS